MEQTLNVSTVSSHATSYALSYSCYHNGKLLSSVALCMLWWNCFFKLSCVRHDSNWHPSPDIRIHEIPELQIYIFATLFCSALLYLFPSACNHYNTRIPLHHLSITALFNQWKWLQNSMGLQGISWRVYLDWMSITGPRHWDWSGAMAKFSQLAQKHLFLIGMDLWVVFDPSEPLISLHISSKDGAGGQSG